MFINSGYLKIPRGTFCLLVISNLLFIVLAMSLAFFNRLAVDDFGLLDNVKQFGVAGGVKHYYTWGGRWASTLLAQKVVLSASEKGKFLCAFGVASVVLLTASVWFLISRLSVRFLKTRISLFYGLNLALFFSSILFFSTADTSQVWYWVSGTTTYLWPLIYAFTATALIIKERPSLSAIIVASLLFAFVAGSNESIAFLSLIILMIALGITLSNNRHEIKICWKKSCFYRVLLPFLFCLVSFIVVYLALGNNVRKSCVTDFGMFHVFIMGSRGTLWSLSNILAKNAFGIGLAALFGYFWGNAYRTEKRISTQEAIPTFFIIAATVVIITIITIFPGVYSLGGGPPPRVWVQISVAIIAATFYTGFYIAKNIVVSLSPNLLPIGIAIGAWLILNDLVAQVPLGVEYARSVDERYKLLQEKRLSGNTAELKLEPLAPSGLLFSSEIYPDPTNGINISIKRTMDLDFDIALKQ